MDELDVLQKMKTQYIICTFGLISAISNSLHAIDLNLQFVSNQGVTSIYRAPIQGSQISSIQAVQLTDANVGGGSDGVYSGFDLDFVFIDRDGDLATTNDRIFPVLNATTILPGGIRNPQSTTFRPVPTREGILFGLSADGTINEALSTLSLRDASYADGIPVDQSSGWLTLGEGGRVSVSFPLTSIAANATVYLFVGEVGINSGESLDTSVNVFTGESSLEIFTAIELRFTTKVGVTYQMQISPNMVDWQNSGPTFLGSGNVETRFYSTAASARSFYRLVETSKMAAQAMQNKTLVATGDDVSP